MQENSWCSFFSWRVFIFSVSSSFKCFSYLNVLALPAITSEVMWAFTCDSCDICLSFFAPCNNAQPKEMLNMLPFSLQVDRLLIWRKLLSYCRAKADSVVAAAAVLILSSATHHLLQSWQNVQMHLILPSSIKRAFNDCTLNTVGSNSISLKKVIRGGEKKEASKKSPVY